MAHTYGQSMGCAEVRKLREQKLKEEEERETRIAIAKHKKMTGRMTLAKQREAACAPCLQREKSRVRGSTGPGESMPQSVEL